MQKHRVSSFVGPLREHLAFVKEQHARDLEMGAGYVEVPEALARYVAEATRQRSQGTVRAPPPV